MHLDTCTRATHSHSSTDILNHVAQQLLWTGSQGCILSVSVFLRASVSGQGGCIYMNDVRGEPRLLLVYGMDS